MFKTFRSLFLFVIITAAAFAQEGMWMLNQIDKLDLKKKGLQMEVSDVYNKQKPALYNAIIQLGGGTASFVSSEGLIVTNHHVAFTAVQRASSKENDYLANGFLAKTRKDEIKAPGYVARVLLEMLDVTAEINEAMKSGKDPVEKEKLRGQKIAKMKETEQKGKDDIQATVAEMFNGKQQYLFIYKLLKDVRLVYVPPLAIGNYGGETDNWMWPRHTGDFTFLRVYCAPDGSGNEYSETNVPYKPKVWLKTAKGDLKDGDFTFIMGFPGFTTRYRSSTSVDWNLNKNYPVSIKNFKEIIEIAESLTKNDREGAIKVSNLVKGLANTMKNFEGKVTAMNRTNFLQKKLDYEKDFMNWANGNPARKAKYGSILDREKAEYTAIGDTKKRDDVVGLFGGLSGMQISVAMQIYAIAAEREKPESERQPGLEDAIKQTVEELQYTYNDYYEPFDKAIFIRTMQLTANLPKGQRVDGLSYLLDKSDFSIEKFANEAFASSKLNSLDYAKSLFTKSTKELIALNDPFITIAAKIEPVMEEAKMVNQRFGANVTAIRKEYLDAIFEWKGMNMYPDANSTMRFTYGNIK
ncbi:MAG: S46 family peptidase [Ignavibacteriales bacterium]|nr:S46 family peptidase [Ignavibacteriales bacterium]